MSPFLDSMGRSTKAAKRFAKAGGVASRPRRAKRKSRSRAEEKVAQPARVAPDSEDDDTTSKKKSLASMDIDDFLGGGFAAASSDEEDGDAVMAGAGAGGDASDGSSDGEAESDAGSDAGSDADAKSGHDAKKASKKKVGGVPCRGRSSC